MSISIFQVDPHEVILKGTRAELVALGCAPEWLDDCLRTPTQRWGKNFVCEHGLGDSLYVEAKYVRQTGVGEVRLWTWRNTDVRTVAPSWVKPLLQHAGSREVPIDRDRIEAILKESRYIFGLRTRWEGYAAEEFMMFIGRAMINKHLREGPRRPDAAAA